MIFSLHILSSKKIWDRKGTTKKLSDKRFAERSGEFSGAICLKALVLLGNDPVIPLNCSENSLVLFVRFLGFCESFWLLREKCQRSQAKI